MVKFISFFRLRLAYFFILVGFWCITNCGTSHPTSRNPSKLSLTTGRPFNQVDTLRVIPFKGEPALANMVYVDGGYMIMGNLGEDTLGTGGRYAKPVTVTSFYIDKTAITNLDYREYLHDLRINGLTKQYAAAMPNQNVWVQGFSYNDPYVENYLEAPGFMYYPVVGVSWEQAIEYCKWRTKTVNNEIKKRGESLNKNNKIKKRGTSTNNEVEKGGASTVATAVNDNQSGGDDLPLLVFWLPSEAQWEYAARGIVGVPGAAYLQNHQRTYPWSSSVPRGKDGRFLANFKRGKGNYKGMAGESDNAAPTSEVYAYPPNDLGIYDMVGNVCCWVSDTYRPLSLQDNGDFNPIRRDGLLDNADSYNTGNGKTSLINDHAKVYKGCSWADSAYFLQIGTRRFLNKDDSTATIGFRCVVSSLGR